MDKAQLHADLARLLPDVEISSDPVILYAYATDVSQEEGAPDVIVRPERAEDVEQVVKYAARHHVPVIPRGAATGAAGGVVPVAGGIVLDFTRMNKILAVDLENRSVVVQPGVVQEDLNAHLAPLGFFFPVIPGSAAMATIGGMVGNDASGRKTIRYGTTKEWVRNLEVVFANGVRTRLGRPVLKSVAGYDLTRLVVGSEGTLAVVTEITLRIAPIPRFTRVVQAVYDDLARAGRTVARVFTLPVTPSSMEILDQSSLRALHAYAPELELPTDAEAILLVEIEGFNEASLAEQAKIVAEECEAVGAGEIRTATTPAEVDRLWEARSLVGAAANNVRDGYARVYVGEDIVVPVSRIPEILKALRELSRKYDFPIVVFGHIGDGNLHPAVTIRKEKACDLEALRALETEIHETVLALDGSVTGEHGIGRARKKYMPRELGVAYEIMRLVKRALDPDDILNPGVIF